MADMVDLAQECIPNIQEKIKQINAMFDGESNKECDECGEEIPEVRRKLGNVKLCVDCATDLEKRQSRIVKFHSFTIDNDE